MPATGTVTVSGAISGLPSGSRAIGPLTVSPTNASGHVIDVVLASGDNTITVPSTPTTSGCIIQFGASSTTTKKLKGIGADTGITVTKTGFAVLCWDTAAVPGSFVINSSAADTGQVTEITFF